VDTNVVEPEKEVAVSHVGHRDLCQKTKHHASWRIYEGVMSNKRRS